MPAKAKEKTSVAKKPAVKKTTASKAVKAPAKSEAVSKLRIRVRAYEYKILDVSVKQIIDTTLPYYAKI